MSNFLDSPTMVGVGLEFTPQRHHNESRPLLSHNDSQTFEVILQRLWICLILALSFVAVTIGMYLFILQNLTDLPMIGDCELVPYEEWSECSMNKRGPRSDLPVTNVLLMQTNTGPCYNESDCSKLLNDVQYQHMLRYNQTNIAFNFIVAGNEVIYEGRGWGQKPFVRGYPYGKVLSIAFIGSYGYEPPSESQIENAKTFIGQAIDKGYIMRCCSILAYDYDEYKHSLLDAAVKIEKHIRRMYQCPKIAENSSM